MNSATVTVMVDESVTRPSYLHGLFSGLPDKDLAPTLDVDEEREVGERLKQIVESRAEAAVSGRDYLIH